MQPPGSPPPPIDHRSQSGDSVRWSAVGIGIAIDWVATLTASMLVVSFATAIATSRSKSPDSAERYLEQLQSSPDFMLVFLLVGLLCVSLGAFVAARRAGFGEIRHGALVGVGSIALSLAMDGLRQPPEVSHEIWNPVWLNIVGYLLVIPFGALGGMLAERMRSDSEAELR